MLLAAFLHKAVQNDNDIIWLFILLVHLSLHTARDKRRVHPQPISAALCTLEPTHRVHTLGGQSLSRQSRSDRTSLKAFREMGEGQWQWDAVGGG